MPIPSLKAAPELVDPIATGTEMLMDGPWIGAAVINDLMNTGSN